MRDLVKLPKAHLHLHFTGAMRPATMLELAASAGIKLPSHLQENDPLKVPANRRGWFRFQRSYDAARALVRSEETMRRIIFEAAQDEAREGSVRLELQIDPTSYAPYVGGITPALEIVLDEARDASTATGVQVAIIVAASRMRHPLEARTLARLAARHSGEGPGAVVGFGLSNDERSGDTANWAAAFRIARRAGLAGVPHGGELLGPEHIRQVMTHLKPARLGHGVRCADDEALLERLVEEKIGFEVCPASNVSLGVYPDRNHVPVRKLFAAGARIALGADDPLLFRSRLLDQYENARHSHAFTDAEIATLARGSILASLASPTDKKRWLALIDRWLEKPA